MCPGSVKIDLTPGAQPGQLQAAVSFVMDDGCCMQQNDPITIEAGNTLTYGLVHAECDVTSSASYGASGNPSPAPPAPTPTPGPAPTPTPPGNAPQPAGAAAAAPPGIIRSRPARMR